MRTIFKLCACGKAARSDSFQKQHGKLMKEDKENHRIKSIKYYCFGCQKIKFQRETLKAWHSTHENCQIVECNKEMLNKLFHEEIKQINLNELNKAADSILKDFDAPTVNPVSSLSDTPSSDEDNEENHSENFSNK